MRSCVRRRAWASITDGLNDDQPLPQLRQTLLDTNPSGSTARSLVGQVGQSQTRNTAAQQAGIKLMGRIASRMQNRNRDRIDRNYDPQVDAADDFVAASEQARAPDLTP